MELAAGGGGVTATYGPMAGLSAQLNGQAEKWTDAFAKALATCGNPTLDGAIADMGGQFAAGTAKLAGVTSHTATFVARTTANFHSADGGA